MFPKEITILNINTYSIKIWNAEEEFRVSIGYSNIVNCSEKKKSTVTFKTQHAGKLIRLRVLFLLPILGGQQRAKEASITLMLSSYIIINYINLYSISDACLIQVELTVSCDHLLKCV